VVNALPVPDAGTYPAACLNGGNITLVGTPAGGTFSGTGVTGNTFNPATAGLGSHTITYNYTDPNGCSASDNATIAVNAAGTVDAGTYAPVCIAGAPITLAGTPAGGTFSGPGVTGTTFNPATAGAGTHSITYNYTNANGCSGSDQADIQVYALPTVNAGGDQAVCVDAAAVALAGTPTGGTFTGPGVTANTFNPATAGVGSHTITYNYTDASGCSASDTRTIVVNALPVADAGTYTAVCVNATAVPLTGTPAGGTWSGPGVTGSSFNPATAGAGTHTITYNYTDGNSCRASDIATIVVNALPVVNAGTYAAICSDAASITLAGTPAGGTFSGPGVAGNAFTPSIAGPGTHTITYSYTDGNSCTASRTTTITVHALPTPAPGVYAPVCINVASITLAGTPAGGIFSGPGVTGNTFNPAAAGTGPHTITYTYTNANGCTAANGTSIVVNPIPVVTAGTYAPICAEKAPIALTGTPAGGGTWSGPGVSGTNFNPGAAAVGNNTVTYSFTANTGCASTSTATIRVNPTPTSTFTLDNSICLNETSSLQATGTVSTGTINNYSWTFGSTVPPATYTNSNPFTVTYPAHGNFNITLVTTSDQGCTSTMTTTAIGVHPLPVVNFGLPAGICLPEGIAVFTNSSSVPDGSALTYQWNFDDPGSGASNTSTVPGPSHTYNTVNNYDVTLLVRSAFGCEATATQVLDDFYNKPVANFSVDPAELCQGEQNTFASTSTDPAGLNITGYKWTFGDNTSSSPAVSPTHTYTRPGTFEINLQVTNEIGCQSLPFPQSVRVHLQPIIDAGKSFVVPAGTQVEFNAISNSQGFTFSWDPPLGLSDPGKLKPTLIANEDQRYTLTAIGEFGCTATDFLTVKVLMPVKVPNVFTPNGDGIHDTWLIPNLADYPACTVEVFNRYGQQVFYIAGYNKPWDGTYKGKDLPVGTYYYIIRLSNGYAPMSGSITIVR
jgi:gliding motility-associated-like protein